MMTEQVYVTAKDIENELLNLKQIIFEVTDACNLHCRYCGFGEIYEGYDCRESKYMDFEKAKILIDYLVNFWSSRNTTSLNPLTFLSFYGGEPLLNMSFIEKTISYIESFNLPERRFGFSMTTNGMLLAKYMDYLVQKDFHLLISLDGNEKAHSYRLTHLGKNSFPEIFANVKLLQKRYPEYFKRNVNFNAVLHNRNSVIEICDFFKEHFGKRPVIAELSTHGIRSDKVDEFEAIYKNKDLSLQDYLENNKKEDSEIWFSDINQYNFIYFLHRYSGNVFNNYNSLLQEESNLKRIPTGTCIPFSRKMFVTVNGKILPCERINHSFYYGVITNRVCLDCDKIATDFNELINKLSSQCQSCYGKKGCLQCIYYIDNIHDNSCSCREYMSKSNFESYYNSQMDYLLKHPQLYAKIMKEVLVD